MTDRPSLEHLHGHHRDFAAFRDAMIETTAGRFGPLWWGVWDHHVRVHEGATLVDLGTGPGLLLPMLRARHPTSRLIGVEVQPEMLPVARQSAAAADATIVEADLMSPLPLADASADIVISVMVFHELPFPPTLLDTAARLLKPGGTLVLWDWVKRPLAAYLGDGELDEDALQHFREHCLFAAEDLEFLCRRVGLEIVERVDRRGGNFSIVVARKPEAA
jgi:SAM-dependent methyltransferase